MPLGQVWKATFATRLLAIRPKPSRASPMELSVSIDYSGRFGLRKGTTRLASSSSRRAWQRNLSRIQADAGIPATFAAALNASRSSSVMRTSKEDVLPGLPEAVFLGSIPKLHIILKYKQAQKLKVHINLIYNQASQ